MKANSRTLRVQKENQGLFDRLQFLIDGSIVVEEYGITNGLLITGKGESKCLYSRELEEISKEFRGHLVDFSNHGVVVYDK